MSKQIKNNNNNNKRNDKYKQEIKPIKNKKENKNKKEEEEEIEKEEEEKEIKKEYRTVSKETQSNKPLFIRLFIGGIEKSITENQIKERFIKYGKVLSIELINKQWKGYRLRIEYTNENKRSTFTFNLNKKNKLEFIFFIK